jgi:hypothetical protein
VRLELHAGRDSASASQGFTSDREISPPSNRPKADQFPRNSITITEHFQTLAKIAIRVMFVKLSVSLLLLHI